MASNNNQIVTIRNEDLYMVFNPKILTTTIITTDDPNTITQYTPNMLLGGLIIRYNFAGSNDDILTLDYDELIDALGGVDNVPLGQSFLFTIINMNSNPGVNNSLPLTLVYTLDGNIVEYTMAGNSVITIMVVIGNNDEINYYLVNYSSNFNDITPENDETLNYEGFGLTINNNAIITYINLLELEPIGYKYQQSTSLHNNTNTAGGVIMTSCKFNLAHNGSVNQNTYYYGGNSNIESVLTELVENGVGPDSSHIMPLRGLIYGFVMLYSSGEEDGIFYNDVSGFSQFASDSNMTGTCKLVNFTFDLGPFGTDNNPIYAGTFTGIGMTWYNDDTNPRATTSALSYIGTNGFITNNSYGHGINKILTDGQCCVLACGAYQGNGGGDPDGVCSLVGNINTTSDFINKQNDDDRARMSVVGARDGYIVTYWPNVNITTRLIAVMPICSVSALGVIIMTDITYEYTQTAPYVTSYAIGLFNTNCTIREATYVEEGDGVVTGPDSQIQATITYLGAGGSVYDMFIMIGTSETHSRSLKINNCNTTLYPSIFYTAEGVFVAGSCNISSGNPIFINSDDSTANILTIPLSGVMDSTNYWNFIVKIEDVGSGEYSFVWGRFISNAIETYFDNGFDGDNVYQTTKLSSSKDALTIICSGYITGIMPGNEAKIITGNGTVIGNILSKGDTTPYIVRFDSDGNYGETLVNTANTQLADISAFNDVNLLNTPAIISCGSFTALPEIRYFNMNDNQSINNYIYFRTDIDFTQAFTNKYVFNNSNIGSIYWPDGGFIGQNKQIILNSNDTAGVINVNPNTIPIIANSNPINTLVLTNPGDSGTFDWDGSGWTGTTNF